MGPKPSTRVGCCGLPLGTQKAHKHKHFIGISLPYWASLRGGLYGISLSLCLLMCLLGVLLLMLRLQSDDGCIQLAWLPKQNRIELMQYT